MIKKIMIEKSRNKNKIEVWEYNKKGFYNFKEYVPLSIEGIKSIKKSYKNHTIIDKSNILNCTTKTTDHKLVMLI